MAKPIQHLNLQAACPTNLSQSAAREPCAKRIHMTKIKIVIKRLSCFQILVTSETREVKLLEMN